MKVLQHVCQICLPSHSYSSDHCSVDLSIFHSHLTRFHSFAQPSAISVSIILTPLHIHLHSLVFDVYLVITLYESISTTHLPISQSQNDLLSTISSSTQAYAQCSSTSKSSLKKSAVTTPNLPAMDTAMPSRSSTKALLFPL